MGSGPLLPRGGPRLAAAPSLAANLAGEEAVGLTTFADAAAGRFGPAGDEAAPDAPPLPSLYRSAGPNFFRDFLLPLDLDDYRETIGQLRRLAAAGPEVDHTAELRRIGEEFERMVEERRLGPVTTLLAAAAARTSSAARRQAHVPSGRPGRSTRCLSVGILRLPGRGPKPRCLRR